MAAASGGNGGVGRLRITETFDDGRANPEPIVADDEDDLEPENFLDNYISAAKLRSLTGIDDLSKVTYLDMRVDTTENSLGDFGSLLPSLVQLKLSNSIIASVRDLGTSLSHLRVLWMARCGLGDLDGIISLGSLRELYLAFNVITELSPLTMLDELEVLDIEGNLVDDIAQVEFLALCPALTSLTIDSNPITTSPKPEGVPPSPAQSPGDQPYDYRAAVCKLLPRLQFLDDEPVNGHVRPPNSNAGAGRTLFSKQAPRPPSAQDDAVDKMIVASSLGLRPGTAIGDRPGTSMGARPGSALGARPGTSMGARPGTSMGARPGTSMGARPGTSMGRPGSSLGARPGTAMGRVPTAFAAEEDVAAEDSDDGSSNLTHGIDGVLCGNPVRALRARRDGSHLSPAATPAPKSESKAAVNARGFDSQPEATSPGALNGGPRTERLEDIFEELRAWRERFQEYKPTDLESPSDGDDDSDNEDEGVLQQRDGSGTPRSSAQPLPHVPLGSSPSSLRSTPNAPPSVPMDVIPTPPSLSRPRTAPNNVRRRLHLRASTDEFKLPAGSESLHNSPSRPPPPIPTQRPLSVPTARPRVLGKIQAPPTPGERTDKRAMLRGGPIVAASTESPRVVRFDDPRPVTAFGPVADDY